MSEPKASRPTMPGYGLEKAKAPPGEKLPWNEVVTLLAAARNYWIGSTWPDGRPHAMPVWGVWLDGALYFSTGDRSRKARNLAADPRCLVHVEAGDVAIVVEGEPAKTDDPETLKPVWAAYKSKYDWIMDGEPFYFVRPRLALSFREDLGETATRWTFET
jgi:nitroimidazol reductase NimA-like FMN-containing flavoprotein (pyridoxamine 5'-phosphate oxidase superfamily)